jgi:3-oxoacyl-[acyl-carrier-protein] synthase III
MSYYTQIVGTGSGFPEHVMTNEDFTKFIETSDEWIRTRTGIATRRIIRKGESTLTLSRDAAQRALSMANMKGSDIDMIIVGTVTPESVMPTTANFLQRDLGATRAFTFDLQAACSGFLYALSIADQYIKNGTVSTALVVGAETLSTLVNWKDRTTCILFGDAAGAAVLKRSTSPEHGLMSVRIYSDGTKGECLKIPHGYGFCPPSSPDYDPLQHKILMQGSEVFKLACRAMIDSSLQVISDAKLTPADVDYFIFHQANIRIIDYCAEALGITKDKTWINVDKYGNTSAATLPVCLDEAWKAGAVGPGKTVLMTTFGGGVTWGAALFRL